ncbi:MAG: hypothetical protein ACR2J8_02970, partial [Thermomicrobiales bacterium]
ANAGTAIADASGGDNNIAMGGGSAGGGGTVSSVGNAGLANADANGGAVSIGDVNSGSNAGNVIVVGNTIAGPWEPKPEPKPKPVCCEPVKPGKPGGQVIVPGKAPKVHALPSTGAGLVDPGLLAALAAAGSVGVAGLGLRRR